MNKVMEKIPAMARLLLRREAGAAGRRLQEKGPFFAHFLDK